MVDKGVIGQTFCPASASNWSGLHWPLNTRSGYGAVSTQSNEPIYKRNVVWLWIAKRKATWNEPLNSAPNINWVIYEAIFGAAPPWQVRWGLKMQGCVLCCAVLHCDLLCVFCCVVLHYISCVLSCIVLYFVLRVKFTWIKICYVFCCAVLQCLVLCFMLLSFTLHCFVLCVTGNVATAPGSPQAIWVCPLGPSCAMYHFNQSLIFITNLHYAILLKQQSC